jgi:ABC-type nitrate/sulfonate/bicarbonate transport system permease component
VAEVTAPRGLRLPERALPWLSVAGVLVLFEALPRVGLLPEDHFPPMSLILGELASETTDSAFWSALGHTLEGWSLGLGIAALVAVPLGILALAYQPEMLLMDEPFASVDALRRAPTSRTSSWTSAADTGSPWCS